ncbi:MAG TPA: FecR domain-containing protein [Steroidobacteraceae bacterium]|jgi:transmembrane sensor
MSAADRISDEAADWLIRLETASTPGLWDGMQAWLDADPRHRAAFVRIRVAWHRVDALKNMRPLDGTVDSDLLARARVTPSSVALDGARPLKGDRKHMPREAEARSWGRWLAAASAAVAAGVMAWLVGRPSWRTYDTAVGGRDEVTLQDGSKVQLNTDTALRVRLTGRRRDVSLLRGEALFLVAHDPRRPFYVSAGHTLVRALGTEFAVRVRDESHIDVLVADGRVEVDEEGLPQASGAAAGRPTEVSAGECAEAEQARIYVIPLQANELVRRLAWTSGHLSFQGESLEEATREFNRYNRLQLVIGDRSIARLQVGGIFLARDPVGFAAALQSSFGIQAARSPDEIRLFPGPDN